MSAVDAGPIAVLSSIALSAVGALIWVVKRRPNGNGNGHAYDREDRDRINRSVAYIEEHKIEMPQNWREYVEQRILHKRRSDAMSYGILATLLRRGLVDDAAGLLEALERDARDHKN